MIDAKHIFRVALLFGLMAATAVSAKAVEEIRLIALGAYAPSASWVRVFHEFYMPEVDKRLAEKGEYRIEWIKAFSGTVAKPAGILEALQRDIGDIGMVTTPFHPDKVPFFNIAYVTPFVSTDIDLISKTINEIIDRHPEVSDVFGNYNQVYLTTLGSIDSYQMVLANPITDLSDLRGSKIAGIGMNLRYLEGLGAVGVGSNLADFYNNVSTGLVDGVILWAEAASNLRFYEVAPYMIDARIGGVNSKVVTVNKRTWDRLPQPVQVVLKDVAIEFRAELSAYATKAGANGLKNFAAKGKGVIRLTEEQRRQWANNMPNLALEWAEDLEKRGLPGHQMLVEYMDAMRANNQPIMRHWDREGGEQ